ncbi:hypothetical protein MNB_SV-3-1522 [hydrothermal vent metagenome]|uniref:GGDEF domain-containing protein n=1 Tax=hydrothermal vent metagenome TaxID=652676 RepID=A0A1W1CF36_9ZZZZ
MRNIQIILNAVLSKNIFEYVLIDKDFSIVGFSENIKMFLDATPKTGEDILIYLPELIGSENEIKDIFSNVGFTYLLESVHKTEYYINISIEHYDENTLLVLLHNITDITVSKQKLLQYSNESILLNNTLQKIIDNQNALLFVAGKEEITYANEQFMEYFSIKRESDLRRKNLKIYKYADSSLRDYYMMYEWVNAKEVYITIGKDTFLLNASMIESSYKLFTLTKITKLSAELQRDKLTGIYNKNYFNTVLETLIREKEEGVLAVLDIDNFKSINDTYGHLAGDDILKELTQLIQDNIRREDIFARWGGEEFLLLLKHTNVENALLKLERVRKVIDTHQFKYAGHVTVSFGVAKSEENEESIHSLLQRADQALYKAKNNGKNMICFKSIEN